jgi:hypothetical protein
MLMSELPDLHEKRLKVLCYLSDEGGGWNKSI